MSNPDTIMDVLKERGARYGKFSEHAKITYALKSVMHSTPKWAELPDNMKECLDMVSHKIGRILNGDPNYLDSWVDIEGYVKLVSDKLKGKDI